MLGKKMKANAGKTTKKNPTLWVSCFSLVCQNIRDLDGPGLSKMI